ncbi:polysaccharide lyase family 7 protein [Pseudomonas sp. RIT-PI-S]|uniref:polysaccharide lyase family 7 protein n=1 Tax=Pseudomonas sp. RIT-PI-S TaxID=3035295 RepID=UPI0021D80584|nr:polysaccharide lyase family 7 protein [Pseudomonas sp. RIT-PI-S]
MIDLSTWNLSIPVGSPAKTIETPVLMKGYKDKYFRKDGSKLYFWAPVTGSTTESAKYPRSELRETYADGSLRNWKYPEADNYLRAKLTVTEVPSSGKVVIGQIHQYGTNDPLLKVEYQYMDSHRLGNIVAKLRKTPSQDDPTVITIAEQVPLNQPFSYIITLTKGGKLSVLAANYGWNTELSSKWKEKPLYFKAGVYTQDHTGYSSEGGRVVFENLSISHKHKS